ncbi:MAG: AAA family ATPase [Candidatus Porifericomitaceae bacterium WSBS_2022_MAG_OTU9]
MLEKRFENTLNRLYRQAHSQRLEYVTVEHLLLGLMSNDDVSDILKGCGVDTKQLHEQLLSHVRRHSPVKNDADKRDTLPTLSVRRILQRALIQMQSSGRDVVDCASVLAAMLHEKDTYAVKLLQQHGLTKVDVLRYISHGHASDSEPMLEVVRDNEIEGIPDKSKQQKTLEEYTSNLNQKVHDGKILPLIGRDREVRRMMQVLCRRNKNNPLLVGEAGVGKTALAEGLAWCITKEKVPKPLLGHTVYALDLGVLIAGTKYRGDFEKRLKDLIAALQEQQGSILFLDEIHTIIGAGATANGTMDLSSLLKPVLTASSFPCIGATTYSEYQNIFERDHALARRFQKIDINAPSEQETLEILTGLKQHYEQFHEVRYSHESLQSAIELSVRHLHERQLPDKAIDVIDEAGARNQLRTDRQEEIATHDIEQIIADMAQIPPRSVSSEDKENLASLENNLKQVVFGQDEAITRTVAAIKIARAGLNQNERPIGCFLFAGPTGVGKTELARQLARILGLEMQRLDMSEYREGHSIAKLIGAPPGYVGHDNGGVLTNAIRKKPYCVLLLDEIEKSHTDIMNLLLQVMDYGILTDSNGRHVDMRKTILVMTTNAGAAIAARPSIGFTMQNHSLDTMKEITRIFSPEFRNRLDAIIQFAPLDENIILQIAQKFMVELEAQLQQHKVSLHMDDSALHWLASNGFDNAMGARPMARIMRDKLRQQLAEELLFGKLSNGGQVTVIATEDGLDLKIEEESAVPQ